MHFNRAETCWTDLWHEFVACSSHLWTTSQETHSLNFANICQHSVFKLNFILLKLDMIYLILFWSYNKLIGLSLHVLALKRISEVMQLFCVLCAYFYTTLYCTMLIQLFFRLTSLYCCPVMELSFCIVMSLFKYKGKHKLVLRSQWLWHWNLELKKILKSRFHTKTVKKQNNSIEWKAFDDFRLYFVSFVEVSCNKKPVSCSSIAQYGILCFTKPQM